MPGVKRTAVCGVGTHRAASMLPVTMLNRWRDVIGQKATPLTFHMQWQLGISGSSDGDIQMEEGRSGLHAGQRWHMIGGLISGEGSAVRGRGCCDDESIYSLGIDTTPWRY